MSLLENYKQVFQTVYAQTKICPVITQHRLSDSVDDICKTAGQPVLQTEIFIRSVDETTSYKRARSVKFAHGGRAL